MSPWVAAHLNDNYQTDHSFRSLVKNIIRLTLSNLCEDGLVFGLQVCMIRSSMLSCDARELLEPPFNTNFQIHETCLFPFKVFP